MMFENNCRERRAERRHTKTKMQKTNLKSQFSQNSELSKEDFSRFVAQAAGSQLFATGENSIFYSYML